MQEKSRQESKFQPMFFAGKNPTTKLTFWLFLTYEYRVEGNSFMEQTTSNLLFKEQFGILHLRY
jgi:hypothetical protein